MEGKIAWKRIKNNLNIPTVVYIPISGSSISKDDVY